MTDAYHVVTSVSLHEQTTSLRCVFDTAGNYSIIRHWSALALRDSAPRTPPGPEGSNGSGLTGRRRMLVQAFINL